MVETPSTRSFAAGPGTSPPSATWTPRSRTSPPGSPPTLEGTDKRPIELLFHEMLERGVHIGKSGFVTLSLPRRPETDERFLTALLTALESSMRVVAGEALQEPSSGSAAPY
ncbi:hypothetical protein [Streptomyces vietnamensis]|uniref:hypothetical protein n=1 Tax=Streptomyces vietnamensis TaxID=362257 RepID=UPI00131C6643|nr:hypothetical protein [Streptomyces vietnamensis]